MKPSNNRTLKKTNFGLAHINLNLAEGMIEHKYYKLLLVFIAQNPDKLLYKSQCTAKYTPRLFQGPYKDLPENENNFKLT